MGRGYSGKLFIMKTGILIANLGSPDSPSVKDVRRYLRQFLMDPYVIDIPVWLRFLIVELAILPTRPHASAEAYQSVWTAEGSPLVTMSRRFVAALQEKKTEPVALAMRYGSPSMEFGVNALLSKNVDRIVLVPMYPHFAMSSVTTAVVEFESVLNRLAPAMERSVVPPFFEHPLYIAALTQQMRPYVSEVDHILFSYHGLPERHLRKTDPTGAHCLTAGCCEKPSAAHATCYRHQVRTTTQRVVDQLGLSSDQWSLSFQSRLGKDPWLTPFTDKVIPELAARGVKRLGVVCPAFVADCLETIEEIGDRGRAQFLAEGGTEMQMIPCLNDGADWVTAMATIIQETVAATL